MFTYISLGLLAFSGVFILINVLKGLIRGIKKTIGTLVAIILSAIIAAIITAIICNPTSELMVMVMQMLNDAIGEGALKEIFAINEIGEAVSYYVSMIAAPFVFLALYIVLSLIVGIIVRIAIKFIPPHQKPRPIVHKLGGVGVGLVCGILVSSILLIPVVGVLDIVVSVCESDALDSIDGVGELTEMFEGAEDDAIYVMYSSTNGWMFDSLASADYNGERVYLKNDVAVIVAVVGNISVLAGDSSEIAEAQITALHEAVRNLDRSALLKNTLSGVISEMASKWIAGETFLGMGKIDAGELLNPLMDTMFEVLATSDETNIVSDMRTLVGILEVLVVHDLLRDVTNYENMLTRLAGDGVITELINVANRNERMSVLSDEITQLSIRALASTIGIPEDEDERYNRLMSDIANILNDSYRMSYEDRLLYVEENVDDVLDEYGVEVEGQVATDIAVSLIGDLGKERSLEGSDVKEFFMIYAIANGNAGSSASISGFEVLSNVDYKIVCNPDGTISIGNTVLKRYNYSNYSTSKAYVMGKEHVDLGDAAYLYSAESMRSSLIVLKDILANVKRYNECAEPDTEAENLSKMLSAAVEIFDANDGERIDKTKLISELGELLDIMSDSEIFGGKATEDLLTAIFQSKDIRGDLGLSIAEANNFTAKLNETARGENASYATTTQAVSSTVDVMDKLNDKDTSKEERRDSTKKLLSDMSPENAELMGTMTTPSMMVKYGSSEEKSGIVASSVTTLFNNMATYKPDTNSAEGQAQYDAEAEAVNTLLQLAMDSADSDADSLFTREESGEGRTGNTAGEFVDLLVNSEVVGATLVTTVYEEGNTDNPYGVVPSEQDKVELNEEIHKYYEENKNNGDEDLMKKLNAVAIISGMDPVFEIEE